jgi:hypothetical protein
MRPHARIKQESARGAIRPASRGRKSTGAFHNALLSKASDPFAVPRLALLGAGALDCTLAPARVRRGSPDPAGGADRRSPERSKGARLRPVVLRAFRRPSVNSRGSVRRPATTPPAAEKADRGTSAISLLTMYRGGIFSCEVLVKSGDIAFLIRTAPLRRRALFKGGHICPIVNAGSR